MITRPLGLTSRLRPAPRSFDSLYWVNAALIALFFTFFGSRFVLSPGMAVARSDEMLPVLSQSVEGAVPTQLRLEVAAGGRLCIDTGFVSFEGLRQWMAEQAQKRPGATLLVQCNTNNSLELFGRITSAAQEVGLRVQLAALDRPTGGRSADVSP